MYKTILKVIGMLILFLWLTVIGIFAIAFAKNQLWSMGSIITYNRPRNALGWLIVAAIAASAFSAILKLT
ncbi:hypothetical protein ERK18_02910 [Lactobacillus kimbladii]|uniref:hypothetical protein n=1 Tax=Lactobacillus kimbladii TaxID=1218506 RepID=UPI00164F9A28|nr:hypothetical protein [Lactobacillus kimbladii]MBC6341976.1 hypothetical protein [Lactobacillus kimbladii]